MRLFSLLRKILLGSKSQAVPPIVASLSTTLPARTETELLCTVMAPSAVVELARRVVGLSHHLEPGEEESLRAHLETCAPCKRLYTNAMRALKTDMPESLLPEQQRRVARTWDPLLKKLRACARTQDEERRSRTGRDRRPRSQKIRKS